MASYNQSNDTNQSIPSDTDFNWRHLAKAIVLIIVILGTIIGNVLVCIAVCLVRKLRRPCNYLLVSLAVSDLCVAILVMPIALIYQMLDEWPFGPIVCDLWVNFDVLSCTASILNLCMISVDRYYAITKPLEYGVKRTPRRMILCVVIVWVGASLISLPPLLLLGNVHEAEKNGVNVTACIVCDKVYYQVGATLGSFYIPLSVMLVVYYKIFRAARRIVLDEKKAQSHLETHCYLEISVKNGGGPPENKITSQGSSPANAANRVQPQHHRSSSASTNTTCSLDKPSIARCFSSRRSNESQCPMLSKIPAVSTGHNLTPASACVQNDQHRPSNKTSAAATLLSSLKTSPIVANSHHKKLRFQLAKERKASTTLGIIMSAFTICWLPFFFLAVIRPFLSEVPPALSDTFLWLGYANSLLNPIIYATLNRDFRKPFQQILYFRCGNLNHMMREEFYHSQYGDPEQQTYCGNVNLHRGNIDYDEGVEYIEADGESNQKNVEITSTAHESFL